MVYCAGIKGDGEVRISLVHRVGLFGGEGVCVCVCTRV